MQTIYDIGMHNGDDTAYYLKRGFKVVAVDANPAMCASAERRFARQVASGKLKVINIGIAPEAGVADFYINTAMTVQSSFAPKNPEDVVWNKVQIETTTLADIVRENGAPHYIKIDLEGFDAIALGQLLQAGIRPAFLSAEVHTSEPICQMVAMGYTRFNMVNCRTLTKRYAGFSATLEDGSALNHVFPHHSSGPFGDDISQQWVDRDTVLYQWFGRRMLFGNGWYDVHARFG